jgi:hypothetical protein
MGILCSYLFFRGTEVVLEKVSGVKKVVSVEEGIGGAS